MLPVLAEVYRGGLVESRHRGAAVVVDQQGQVLEKWGDAGLVTYWRSSAKPIQAVPVVDSGAADAFGFSAEEIAIMTGSHAGEPQHVKTVQSMLKKMGLKQEHLLCGTHPPANKEAARDLAARGLQPEVWHCNCSGKHAGMLALALHLRADLTGYLELRHPVQQAMLKAVARYSQLSGEEIITGLDGCGVPVFGMPLFNMALAYARLTGAKAGDGAGRVVQSMLAHPEMVAGAKGFCTALIKAAGGKMIAKIGAEGVYCVGLVNQGVGLAVKIEDGNTRALPPVVLEVLARMGFLSADELALLEFFRSPKIKNQRQETVGEIRPVL